MAVPANTHTEHANVGTREDLSDLINMISPMEVPFQSMAGTQSSSQVYTEWQIDNLAAAATNAQIDGDDASAVAITPTTRVGNYNQIASKTVIVSGSAIASDQAGRANELSYQVTKEGMALKRDIEFALVRDQASSAGGAGAARTSAGVESWLSTNATTNATSGSPSTPGFSGGIVASPSNGGSVGPLTKANIDNVAELCWNEGGNPGVIMTSGYNRGVVSTFAGISQLQTDASPVNDVTLVGAVDLYKSNFGTMKVVPNRFMRLRVALVLDMDMFAVSYLRNIQMDALGKTGDSEKRQMLAEFTLVSKNEAASGKVADITSS